MNGENEKGKRGGMFTKKECGDDPSNYTETRQPTVCLDRQQSERRSLESKATTKREQSKRRNQPMVTLESR